MSLNYIKDYPFHNYEEPMLKLERNIFKNKGFCVCCDRKVIFSSKEKWFRDYYLCSNCASIPRERALMYCIEKYYPEWRQLIIHESSPVMRGASKKMNGQCEHYIRSYFYPDKNSEKKVNGYDNIDLQNQRYNNESFDLIITQDVMEHIPDPEKAFREIARTLKRDGAHICTIPLVNKEKKSERIAEIENGKVNFFNLAEYHGDPINVNGAPVFYHWGFDICDYIYKCSGLTTTMVYIDNLELGIRAEYIEVLVCQKL